MSHVMHYRKYVAELLGTFTLTLVVGVAVADSLPITPILAALTLGLFVYTCGGISGGHFNPAVTVGLLSIRKIKELEAVKYVAAQCIGAFLALLVLGNVLDAAVDMNPTNDVWVGMAELVGAFFLTFGVCAVAHGKVHDAASGSVVGGSLLLGGILASEASNAVLNPAVALGISSLSVMYVIGPVAGAILAAQLYAWLQQQSA